MMLSIDLETRSRTNLLTDGLYSYATCPSTEIICMSWQFDGEPSPQTWVPGTPFPVHVLEYLNEGGIARAFNSAFERLMFECVMSVTVPGLELMDLEQWQCTAYKARCNNLPGSLANCARALGLSTQKDVRGRELIRMLCIPRADGSFNKDPDLLQEMYRYCETDVIVEMAIDERCREPSESEWLDFYVNERINDRGVRIDRELAMAATHYARDEEAEMLARISQATDGAVTKARGENLKAWVVERVTEQQRAIMVKYRAGEEKYTLDKVTRYRLLDQDDLDPDVRVVVESSDAVQKSSVSKFRSALSRTIDEHDDRAYGSLVANGAGQSGRYSARGLQLHNYPRKCMGNPEKVRQAMITQYPAKLLANQQDMPIMEILSGMLRPSLIPAEGKHYLSSDWSAIEGRVGPWLCDNPDGEAKLDIYRRGEDPYKHAASSVYGTPYDLIDDDQRQIGKVAELALGFGGGAGAFLAMGRSYGVSMSETEANNIKWSWRADNPWAVNMWKATEQAAVKAVNNPGTTFDAGRLKYHAVKECIVGTSLFCILPCGRVLTYPDARIDYKEKFGQMQYVLTAMKASWTPKVGEKEWPRVDLWGGLLTENAVQGTAASLLRWALAECDYEGLPVVLHVHDEILAETDDLEHMDLLFEIMNSGPEWSEGLPLKADVEELERFGK